MSANGGSEASTEALTTLLRAGRRSWEPGAPRTRDVVPGGLRTAPHPKTPRRAFPGSFLRAARELGQETARREGTVARVEGSGRITMEMAFVPTANPSVRRPRQQKRC